MLPIITPTLVLICKKMSWDKLLCFGSFCTALVKSAKLPHSWADFGLWLSFGKSTKIPDSSNAGSMRLSTGKDTRSLEILYQTNLTKNPLDHFERHIGSLPAGSHTPFKEHNLYKEITRAQKTKTKWVIALNGLFPQDWDCYFGTENRKFNLYLHKHAKHKQPVSNKTCKQPWCWPTKSLHTHLNTAQDNPSSEHQAIWEIRLCLN